MTLLRVMWCRDCEAPCEFLSLLFVEIYGSSTPAPLQSALKRSDCRIDKQIYLAMSELSHVKQGEQTHVCTSSETDACDDVMMKELRFVGLPTSSLRIVPPRYCRLIGNFSSKLPRESRGGVLLNPWIWRYVNEMSTRD